MTIKQTAGRDALGEFAPKFAQLNDDVLFGEVWSRQDGLSLRDRSVVTVVALMAQGLTDSSFRFHLMSAKSNGVTRTEIAEILTHAAFYAGWPKAWAAFRMAKEVWAGTFHSTCVRILRRFGENIGVPRDFSIYDTDDQKRLYKEIMAELDGEIVEVCVQNGQVVDFGCPLFRIKGQ